MNLARIAVVFAVLLSGCATTINLPPITDEATGNRTPGRVVWRDLITDKPAASRRFYETLFGWEFEAVGAQFGLGGNDTYSLIRHNGRLIGGMVDANALNRGQEIAQWVTVVSVTDIDRAVSTFEAEGGTVFTAPTDLNERGRMAVVADPQGAALALLETPDGDPPEREPGFGDFLWEEVWTTDAAGAADFYQRIGGFEVREVGVDRLGESFTYRVLESAGTPRAGIIPNPFPNERPVWVSYLRVADPAAITAHINAMRAACS